MAAYKTIIAGSRDGVEFKHVLIAISLCGWDISTVVSGTARGADRFGEEWASLNNIPIERYPADWDNNKKAAGYIRNIEMADNAEALIALWDGESRGTKHMITVAKRKGLKVFIYDFIKGKEYEYHLGD